MPSHAASDTRNPQDPQDPHDPQRSMIERALRLVGRRKSWERGLALKIIQMTREVEEANKKVGKTKPPDPNQTPDLLLEALECPLGSKQYVVLTVNGEPMPVVVYGQGKADPQRAAYLWKWLRDRAARRAA